MWLDLAVLGVLVAALLVGAVRGVLVSSVRLFGAVAAYLGAWWLGPALAPWLGRFGLDGVLALGMGGLAAFTLLLFSTEILAVAVRALDRRRRGGEPRTSADRLGGAAVSLVAGFAFAILLGWLAVTVDALRVHGGNDALPSTEASHFAPVARRVIRGVGEWVLADRGSTGAAVARAASDPVETLERVEQVLANPHLQQLKDDRAFWQQVESGAYERAVARASFLALAYDGSTRRELAALGLVSEEAAGSSRAFRDASIEALAAIGPRLRAVREDPALARLAEDPQVQEMVLANDTLGLLRHPDVREVIARALSGRERDAEEGA
jgi:uncharacterized membrane protein required for colicin V production